MGIQLARLGDKGTGKCTCHNHTKDKTGTIIGSSTNVIINGKPVALLMDKIITSCEHIGIIIKGSSTTITNGKPTVRLGDKFTGCFTGTIISASPNVLG